MEENTADLARFIIRRHVDVGGAGAVDDARLLFRWRKT